MYIKTVENGFVVAVGDSIVGEEITEAEYNEIVAILHERPTPPDGYDYRLKDDLEWELVELPPTPEPEPTPEEIIDILFGGDAS